MQSKDMYIEMLMSTEIRFVNFNVLVNTKNINIHNMRLIIRVKSYLVKKSTD